MPTMLRSVSGVRVRSSTPTDRFRSGRLALIALFAAALAAVGCGGRVDGGGAGSQAPLAPEAASASRAGGQTSSPRALTAVSTTSHGYFAAQGIACAACHPCGASATHDEGWMDQTSSTFHAVAANSGLANCQSCHGARLDGVGGATTVSCAMCHASWPTNCTMCHGGTDNQTGAPPAATWGHGDSARGGGTPDAVRIGAHTSHLAARHALASPVACSACHVVPGEVFARDHIDGSTATVTFSGLAAQGGTPAWTRASATCAGTYCHGATLKGGTNTTPVWTSGDGSQIACGTCHGVPPPVPHPQNASCGSCHAGYTSISVDATTHVNGVVDVAGGTVTCTSCHGTATRTGIVGADARESAAPPADSHGNTTVGARGVGVHLQHVNQATYRDAPIPCSECHFDAVPTTMAHADGTVQLAFGALAKDASWGGVAPAPVWNGTTCAGTYCHGNFKNGAAAPVTWAQAGGVTCGSCHAIPPGGGHVQNTNCGSCHAGYTSSSVNKALHMNGTLEVVALTCTSCHGSAGKTASASSPRDAAPPVDTLGASTGLRVGAHQSHVAGKTYSSGIACQDCHASVATYTATHANGVTNVEFTNGTSASFNVGTVTPRNGTTAASCAATWCHAVTDRNQRRSGGTTPTQSWTNTITSCTACHGTPPGTGSHTLSAHRIAGCGACHSGYSSSSVNKSLHVSGTRDVGGSGTRILSWNPSTLSCQPSCHGSKTWGGGEGWGG